MKKKNTRIFSLAVSVFFALSIVGTLFNANAGTAHAATRSTTRASACFVTNAAVINGIYDQNTSAYLGYVEVDIDTCHYARAQVFAVYNYHINHLWLRDNYGNNVSYDYGNTIGSSSTGWWYVHTSCAYASAVIQGGGHWGNGSAGYACF